MSRHAVTCKGVRTTPKILVELSCHWHFGHENATRPFRFSEGSDVLLRKKYSCGAAVGGKFFMFAAGNLNTRKGKKKEKKEGKRKRKKEKEKRKRMNFCIALNIDRPCTSVGTFEAGRGHVQGTTMN